MYCQNCHYDLRGQTVPRCPECGRGFDPEDAATYLATAPRLLGRVFGDRWVRVVVSLLVLTVVYFGVVLPGIAGSHCGSLSTRELSRGQLYAIVQAYLANGDAKGENGRLTLHDVRQDLAPSWYSRVAAPAYERANRWKRKASTLATWAVLVVGPALAVAVVFRRRVRKVALVIVLGCVAVGACALMSADVLDGYRHQLSYDYLDDYLMVPTVDWRDAAASSLNRIVGFEKRLWQDRFNRQRVVAQNPHEVRIMKERDFQKLLAEQPAAQESWLDCVAAGECTGRRE